MRLYLVRLSVSYIVNYMYLDMKSESIFFGGGGGISRIFFMSKIVGTTGVRFLVLLIKNNYKSIFLVFS